MSKKITLSLRSPKGRGNLHSLAIFFVAFLSLVGLFFVAPATRAEGDFCFCQTSTGDAGECVTTEDTGDCLSAFPNNQATCRFFDTYDECSVAQTEVETAPASGAPSDTVAGYCFCATPLDDINSEQLPDASGSECTPQSEAGVGDSQSCMSGCLFFNNSQQQLCESVRTRWFADLEKKRGGGIIAVANSPVAQPTAVQKGRAAFLPPCILEDRLDKDSECRDISIFVILGINIANYLFTIIGALALLMFIYGGVLFIISQGNPEKVKKGADAMLAAVIGLIVVFSAYLLVGFLGEVVGVENRFKL